MFVLRCFFVLLSLSFLQSCSSVIRVQVKRAPELNLIGVKSCRIDIFSISGDLDLDSPEKSGKGLLGALIDEALDAAAKKIDEGKGKRKRISADYQVELKEIVLADGYYMVTEGEDFDAQIRGNIHFEVTDKGESKEYKNKKGEVNRWYEINRKADVLVKFTVADKSGNVIGVSEVRASASEIATGDTRGDARDNTKSWELLVREALTKTRESFLHKIAPYFVWEKRKLATGTSNLIKKGNEAAKSGRWEAAVQFWEQAQTSKVEKDQIAAIYNLAICDEVEGRLEDALTKFEKLYSSTREAQYSREVARVKMRIEEEKQMREAAEGRADLDH